MCKQREIRSTIGSVDRRYIYKRTFNICSCQQEADCLWPTSSRFEFTTSPWYPSRPASPPSKSADIRAANTLQQFQLLLLPLSLSLTFPIPFYLSFYLNREVQREKAIPKYKRDFRLCRRSARCTRSRRRRTKMHSIISLPAAAAAVAAVRSRSMKIKHAPQQQR